MTTFARTTGTWLAVTLATAVPALGQESCSSEQQVGVLGITGLACESCSFSRSDGGYTSATFRTEPTIMGVDPDGASAGRLREGDVLVAIDGDLITSREGSRRFTDLPPRGSVDVRVRRGGSVEDIAVPVRSVCRDEPLQTVLGRRSGITVGRGVGRGFGLVDSLQAPGLGQNRLSRLPRAPSTADEGISRYLVDPAATDSLRGRGLTSWGRADAVAPSPPSPELVGRPSTAATVTGRRAAWAPEGVPIADPQGRVTAASPSLRPRARLGFGLRCGDCSIDLGGEQGTMAWDFKTPPVVYGVEEESPAFAAGLREGDVLEAIDGLELTSVEGGRRLGSIRPGDDVVWTVRRGDRTLQIGIVAEERPTSRSAVAMEPLRYSGDLRGTNVEVHGAPVSVTEDLSTGEIVIRSDDLLVRIRVRR